MKRALPVLLFTISTCPSFAQDSLHVFPKQNPVLKELVYKDPGLIDKKSIARLSSTFYLGKLKQDNMPVLIPVAPSTIMPNPGKKMDITDPIPNAWDKYSKPQNSKPPKFFSHPLYVPKTSLQTKKKQLS